MREEMYKILTPEDIAYYTALGINLDSDLMDPQVDLVFKAMFTSDSPESRAALINFLTYAIGRQVKTFELKQNELAVTGLLEKQSTFDIHVAFDGGDEADLEIQIKIKDNLPARAEFLTCKMHGAQDIKGKAYADLKQIYTIVVLGNTLFHDRPEFYDEYQYRNATGRLLTGKTQIIFIELSKLGEIVKKPVADMSGIEKWSVFLRYANHKDMRKIIAAIEASEEGIKMGAEVLQAISSDRDHFIAYFLRLKHEIDQESQLIYAHRQGEAKGEEKKAIEVACKLIQLGNSNDMIALVTGLTIEEIEDLRKETEVPAD